jgi:peptidoglycan-associated lipoprotein
MAWWARWLTVGALALSLVAVGGCGGKKKSDLTGEGAGAFGEENLGAGAGSLAQAKAGTLGSASLPDGPLADIHFAYDSFDLSDEARRMLQGHASWLKDHSGVRLEVEGHCDERGTIEYNLALGAKRAAAAKSYLATLGVSPDRMTTISYGEELPLCHDAVESCWQRNRRAHFVVIGD